MWPVPAFVDVLERLVFSGVAIGDVVADSGYAYRVPAHFALRMRALGAGLVMDLHPSDRGTQGTYGGAICFNGALYCPATPRALFLIEPLSRQASEEETKVHDAHSAELQRYKLGKTSACDADGYHRVACPAVLSKVRCPVREASLALSFSPFIRIEGDHRSAESFSIIFLYISVSLVGRRGRGVVGNPDVSGN